MPIYDVENRFSYYKSYSDNILVGPSKPTIGSFTWHRNVSGSVVSGSEEWRASTFLSDYIFKKENPFFHSGEVRYLRLSSQKQSIQDSYIPDIVGIYLTGSYGSGSLVGSSFHGPNLYLYLYLSRDGFQITGSDGERINNTEWLYSFPFEKKYSGLIQTGQTAVYNNLKSDYYIAESSPNIFYHYPRNLTFPIDKVYLYETHVGRPDGFNKELIMVQNYPGYVDQATNEFISGSIIGTLVNNNILANKFMFGINPKPSLSPVQYIIGSQNNYFLSYSLNYTAEGWKYGFYNGLPTNFSAVFRQNHYGQFRDMLEQRIYTKTYNNPLIGGPMDNNGGINFISGSALAGESNNYITSSIYASDDVSEAYRVNPYGSGIFDKEYRASQPWYDNDPRIGT